MAAIYPFILKLFLLKVILLITEMAMKVISSRYVHGKIYLWFYHLCFKVYSIMSVIYRYMSR